MNKQINNNSKKNPIEPNFLNVYIIFSMEINDCLIGLEFQFGKMKKISGDGGCGGCKAA